MNRWIRPLLGVMLGFAAFGAQAQACSQTLNSGGDLQAALNAAPHNAGFVICLNSGTYNGTTNGGVVFPANGGFAIGKNVTVKGLGASPANVILQNSGNVNLDHVVYFVNYYGGGTTASGAQLVNLTIQGAQGGVQIYNFAPGPGPAGRLTDIKLRDVNISTTTSTVGFGVLVRDADRVVLDKLSIGSSQAAVKFLNATDSMLTNSTISNTSAEAAAALAAIGGNTNRFINNTFGLGPRTAPGDAYSFNAGSVVFYNTSNNRFEGNLVQGMRDDAVDFAIKDNPDGIAAARPLNNYVGKNRIIHSDYNIHGTTAGSTGIWTNCASDNSWIFGNDVQNTAEGGITVWGSKSNMVLGNKIRNNGHVGIFVSGGQEALNECTESGGAFRQKPTNNYLMGNSAVFNVNDEIVIRNADGTVLQGNFASTNDGFNGAAQNCTNSACQASVSVETDGSMFGSSTGTQILGNTFLNTLRGLWTLPDSGGPTGIEFFLNRVINTTNNRWVTGSTQNLDRGNILGGNKWSQHNPTGNPSTGQAFSGIFHNGGNSQTGNVVDRFPYQSEDLGRGYNINVVEPRVNAIVARGTRRTVRWESIGCYWVDLTLSGVALATNTPNTGYAVVDIPSSGSTGTTNIVATCKDRQGNVRSTANSPFFSVTSSTLQLTSPGRDDVFNAGTSIWVAWKNTDIVNNTTLVIEYSSDGGTTWPTLLANVNNQNTTPVTSARVTLPAAGTAYGMIRIRNTGNTAVVDATDGVFSVRGAAGALANVSAGRIFRMGQVERLEWSSPTNSRLVDISATSGNTYTVVTNLPDRGSYDWMVPAFGGIGALSITVTFRTETGAFISNVTNGASGLTRLPTTITFGNPPGIGPGQSGTLTATTNSGAAVTLTSATTGVCTVTGGNTINGVSNGTCIINGNAAATGSYAAALQSQLTFTMGQSQTITFNAPDYLVVGSSIALSATASSGLTVQFSSLTPSICSVSGGNVLTGNSVGTCTVAANQPGSGGFGAAPQVTDNLQAVAGANLPRMVNISTRMQVLTGDNVLIGGFVIGGGTPKNVVVRARGPSLSAQGVPGVLANPNLQLFSGPTMIDQNDNWQSHANATALANAGYAPPDPLDSSIYTTIGPGPFTAIVSGVGGGTGVGIIEVFEVDAPEKRLINISTRGQVLTGADVMIAGFIIQGQAAQTVVVRARGPSLASQGVAGVLANPRMQLFNGPTEIANNDNWGTAPNAAAIQASGFAPLDANEPAIMMTLAPGAYTAIISGVSNTTGVAIVEVFGLE